MRRRGFKSTKVPNVKLRPAQPSLARARDPLVEDVWAQDSQLPSDDTGIIDTCPRPFAGIVLCATGLLDKPGIFRQAAELGATTCSALTDRVTHLIAERHGGAKYMCALERKIPILSPDWIAENYQIWLKGDDVDLEQSLKKYRLPIFSGVVLCLSGIDDIKRRTQINKFVTQYGGTFLKSLERPVRVTHLLCSGEKETDKMHYAEKFNRKGEADIKLVWEEWFWDSLEFGGRFDEDKYQVRQPRPERRQLPIQERTPTLPSCEILDCTQQTQRATTKDDDEEPASVQRTPAIQLKLWESLLKGRGFQIDAEQGRLIRSPTKSQSQKNRGEESGNVRERIPAKEVLKPQGSFLASADFRRANSFALPANKSIRRILSTRKSTTPVPEAKEDDMDINANLQMDVDTPGAGPSVPRAVRVASLNAGDADVNVPPRQADAGVASPSSAIFSGKRFLLLGEADSRGVRDAIRNRGGAFVEGEDPWDEQYEDSVDFVIVRLASGSSLFCGLPSSAPASYCTRFRTECWLERCIFEERICEPNQHVSFTPIGIPCPVDGSEKIFISFSGLDESERCFMSRLVKALGLNLLPTFSKRATHLLCPSAQGLKYDKAKEWGIPVLNMGWVEELKRSGRVPAPHGYLVGHDSTSIKAGKAKTATVVEKPKTVKEDPKGKGKLVEDDPRMVDITNGRSQTEDKSQSFEFRPEITSTQKNPPPGDPPVPIPSLSKLVLSSSAGSFGQPNDLLRNPAEQSSLPDQRSNEASDAQPDCAILPDISAIPALDKGKGKETALMNTRSEPVIPSNTIQSGPILRQPAIEVDISGKGEVDIVPSSRTPSPVKMSALKKKSSNGSMRGRGRGFTRKKSGSVSPVKGHHQQRPMEIDEERAKALQESLTDLLNDKGPSNLLGKRRSEDEVEGVGGEPGIKRVGKRPRPVRLKPRLQLQDPAPHQPYHPAGDYDLSLEFGGHALEVREEVQEESMRVTYEDPGQRDEKRKLMSLFEKQDDDDEVEIVSFTTRKTTTKPASANKTARRKGRKSAA